MATTQTTLRARLDNKITVGDEGDQQQLTFVADYEDGRNEEWAKYTPALSISFVVKDGTAAADFEVGKSYTFAISETTDKPEPKTGAKTADK